MIDRRRSRTTWCCSPGKGHENYQIIGTTKHHFDDVEEATQSALLSDRSAIAKSRLRLNATPSDANRQSQSMKPLTIQQIRQAVGGKALTTIPATAPPVKAVCTDTRRMEPGSLFVAIKRRQLRRPRFSRPTPPRPARSRRWSQEAIQTELPNLHLIQVDEHAHGAGEARDLRPPADAVQGDRRRRQQRQDQHQAPDRLDPRHASCSGSMSPKSFNNDIGVPLTIFPADPMQDYLVLEIGTNHPGEINDPDGDGPPGHRRHHQLRRGASRRPGRPDGRAPRRTPASSRA